MTTATQIALAARCSPATLALNPDLAPPENKTDKRLEKELLRRCLLLLNHYGIRRVLHLSPKAREHKGWPDLTFALHGQPWAVELKARAGRLSEDQRDCLRDLFADGWRVAVVQKTEDFRQILLGNWGPIDETGNHVEWDLIPSGYSGRHTRLRETGGAEGK